MALTGKGMMIWKLPRCEDGSPEKIAQAAQQAGLTHVIIKIANGMLAYNVDRNSNQDLLPPVIRALKAKGIEVWGWHYIYGKNVTGEGRIAIQRVKQLRLDGYVIDAEIEYKQSGMASKAEEFMKMIRTPLANIPIALSSYRYPKYHPQLPWKQFLTYCDYNMPQVYWEQAHTPASQLERCYEQFQAISPNRQIIPTGALYKTNGWLPTPQDIQNFLKKASELGLSAANFYTWDHKQYLTDQWNTLASYNWEKGTVTETFGQQLISYLNTHNPTRLIRLFQENAVFITAKQTLQGTALIQSHFQKMFEIEQPGAEYSLLNETINGSSHTVEWKASFNGNVVLGRDSFSVTNDKIAYHYSQIK